MAWGMPIGDGFTIIISQDEMRRDNPFLETPHQIERIPEASKALTLINRYPSMARIIDSEVEQDIKNKLPLSNKTFHRNQFSYHFKAFLSLSMF